MKLKCVTENLNVNVVIKFFIVCDALASILKEKKNPTVAWKFVHIITILN